MMMPGSTDKYVWNLQFQVGSAPVNVTRLGLNWTDEAAFLQRGPGKEIKVCSEQSRPQKL